MEKRIKSQAPEEVEEGRAEGPGVSGEERVCGEAEGAFILRGAFGEVQETEGRWMVGRFAFWGNGLFLGGGFLFGGS